MLLGKNKSERLTVWIWLLTHCDKDGVVTFGRKQIAKDTGLSEQQVYRILKVFRQKPNNQVMYEANSVYTTITILKWGEYQRKVNNQVNNQVNNKRTISEQQANTNKEVKNKRIKEDVKDINITDGGSKEKVRELIRSFKLKEI
jgi:hypothetical protein